jgi:hypothetical protein
LGVRRTRHSLPITPNGGDDMSIYKYLGCSTAVMAGVMLTWVAPTKAFLYPVAPAATSYIQHADRMRRETAKRKRRQTADVPPTTFEESESPARGALITPGFLSRASLSPINRQECAENRSMRAIAPQQNFIITLLLPNFFWFLEMMLPHGSPLSGNGPHFRWTVG